MNRLIRCSLSALLSLCGLVTSRTASSDASQNRQALVIGVRNYPRMIDKDLKALSYADRDALWVGSVLEAGSGVPLPLSLINSEATAATITARVSHLPHADILFALFSGHAAISAKDGQLYLFPSEAKSLDATSGIRAIDLIRGLVNASAGQVVLFLDACSSGAVISELERSDVDRSRVLVFASSQGGEESYEDPDSQRPAGIFSYFLVKGLQGGADGALDGKPNGSVTAGELRAYLDKKIRERCDALSFKQTPTFSQSTADNSTVLSTVKVGESPTLDLTRSRFAPLEKVLLKLSESRLRAAGRVPESFQVSRMIAEMSKVTFDGKFLIACEDRPDGRSFLVPLEIPTRGNSFDLGIGLAGESNGYLTECKIRESPDSKYVTIWAKSSEDKAHGTLYSLLTIPPTKLRDFVGSLSFFYKDRFVEVNGNTLSLCPLAEPENCETVQTSQPITNVTFGGVSRRPMMAPAAMTIFQSILSYCSPVGCQLETGSGNWEDPDKVFPPGGAPQPDGRSSGIRDRFKDSLIARFLPNGDAVAVMKSGDILKFGDALLKRCCLLKTEQSDFVMFAAGGNGKAVVAYKPLDGTEAGFFVDMFEERKRTGRVRLPDLEKINLLICSKSGNIVVAADGKASVILTFKNGQPYKQRRLHCSSPVTIDESDTWVACADFNIPRIQIENITSEKVTELENPTKPLETLIIGKNFVTAAGLFRMGPHEPEAHVIAWRLPSGERINPADCALPRQPDQIGYVDGGGQLMLRGSSLASVNPLSCELREYGAVPGGAVLQFAGFAGISVEIGPSLGPWIESSTYSPNMMIINSGDHTASMFSAGGSLGKVSLAPDGRDVLVSLDGHIAQFPLDLKRVTALTLGQLGRDFTPDECHDLFPAAVCPTLANLRE